VSGQAYDEDARDEVSVRPKRWTNTSAKNASREYQIAIDAGAEPRRRLDHCSVWAAGSGKNDAGADYRHELRRADQD